MKKLEVTVKAVFEVPDNYEIIEMPYDNEGTMMDCIKANDEQICSFAIDPLPGGPGDFGDKVIDQLFSFWIEDRRIDENTKIVETGKSSMKKLEVTIKAIFETPDNYDIIDILDDEGSMIQAIKTNGQEDVTFSIEPLPEGPGEYEDEVFYDFFTKWIEKGTLESCDILEID